MAFNILFADDNNENRIYIDLVFKKTYHKYTIAVDGKDALDKFNNSKFDLVVTDLYMPNLNGIQLLQEIRKKNKSIPILAFTGASFDDEDPEIKEMGFNEFIHKPIDEKILLDIVEKYLNEII